MFCSESSELAEVESVYGFGSVVSGLAEFSVFLVGWVGSSHTDV